MATDSPSIKFLYPDWQHEYAAALSEINPERQDSDHYTERQVIEDALQGLRTLKKSELGFPD